MLSLDKNKLHNTIVRDIVSSLQEAMPELKGIGAEVYLVGGFTRDYLLGKESNDVDIMCVYPAWAKKTEMDNDVFDFLKNVGMIVSKYVHYIDKDPVSGQPVSAIFPIHSDITLSNQGTLTLTSARQGGGDLSERMHLDIALARTEAYSEETRKPTVKPASFMADANRRDFTINTMSINMDDLSIVDPTGKGISDLLQKFMLRTPIAPYQTFLDDPLRILRAIRMKNRFKKPDGSDFELHPDIIKVFEDKDKMQVLLDRFGNNKKVSPERINEEIGKMLNSGSFGDAVKDLKKLGVLDTVDKYFGKVLDDKVVGVLNEYGKKLDEAIMLAIWFKDFNKVVKEQMDKGDIKKSVNFQDVLKKMKYSNEVIDEVKRLLDVLETIDSEFKSEVSDAKVREITRKLTLGHNRIIDLEQSSARASETFNRFMMVTKAHPDYTGYEEFEKRVEDLGGVNVLRSDVDKTILSGNDLIQLGLKPGKELKNVLDEVEYIIKVLHPFVDETKTMVVDENYIKARLFDANVDEKWYIQNGRLVDKNGYSILDKYKKALYAFRNKLIRIANGLEDLGMFKEASIVDGILL